MSSTSGTPVDIKAADGTADSYVFQPDGGAPAPAVLFYMDGGGLRPALLAMGERLAKAGYYVLLPNLFYRNGRAESFDRDAFMKGGEARDQLMKMIGALTPSVLMRDTKAFLAFLDQQPGAKRGKIGCHGYCMGGKFALAAAGTFPDRVAAAASFHGAGLATDAPDSAHRLVGKIRGKVYVGVSGIDPYLVPGETEVLRKALDAAGTNYVMEDYPGVEHGFTVTDSPIYDKAASERHWDRLLALYGETLR